MMKIKATKKHPVKRMLADISVITDDLGDQGTTSLPELSIFCLNDTGRLVNDHFLVYSKKLGSPDKAISLSPWKYIISEGKSQYSRQLTIDLHFVDAQVEEIEIYWGTMRTEELLTPLCCKFSFKICDSESGKTLDERSLTKFAAGIGTMNLCRIIREGNEGWHYEKSREKFQCTIEYFAGMYGYKSVAKFHSFNSDKEGFQEGKIRRHQFKLSDKGPERNKQNEYVRPSVNLLYERTEKRVDTISKERLLYVKDQIVEAFGFNKNNVERIKATIGPSFTLYEALLSSKTSVTRFKAKIEDAESSLVTLDPRIFIPFRGSHSIGIEVPNPVRSEVSLFSVLDSPSFQKTKMIIPVVLGKDASNKTQVFDLAKMPHLLLAGSEYSELVNGMFSILTSLLLKFKPSQLKLILIDQHQGLRHVNTYLGNCFLLPSRNPFESILKTDKEAISVLNRLLIEMDDRYNRLKMARVRNISDYNKKYDLGKLSENEDHQYMPFIVVLINEFADLILNNGREFEHPVSRLAQLSRAVGIHMVMSTGHPLNQVITRIVKANFPARIAYSVHTERDSHTILDLPGAECLLGEGDILLLYEGKLSRLQEPVAGLVQILPVLEHIKDQAEPEEVFVLPEEVEESELYPTDDLSKPDPLFKEAAHVVVQYQRGSTSLLQRKLSLGYNRAGRIIDQLEEHGILGPFTGSRTREVLVSDENELEAIIRKVLGY